MKNLDQELDKLFRAYRDSSADPEASSGFTPGMWEKIEARRSFAFRVRHLSRAFLGVTAVLCLLLAGVSVVADRPPAADMHESYLDALARAHMNDSMLDAMHGATGEPGGK